MSQQQKIQTLLHRDVDGVRVESRRAATMRPLQSHRYERDGESGTMAATLEQAPPRPRRSLSSFTGSPTDVRTAELAALANGIGAAASASAGSSHNGTLRRSGNSSSALGVGSQSAYGAPSTAGLVATLTARQRSSQPQGSDGTADDTSPNAATVGAGAAQSFSHSLAADSTAALPVSAAATPPLPSSTGRLKVRPQIRSWKHTKEATQDAMSNLALLASRYRAGMGGLHGGDYGLALSSGPGTGTSSGNGSGPGSGAQSNEASDRDTDAGASSEREPNGANSDDDAPSGMDSGMGGGRGSIADGGSGGGSGALEDASGLPDKKKDRGTVGSRIEASLRRKGTNISRRFRDMVSGNFSRSKSVTAATVGDGGGKGDGGAGGSGGSNMGATSTSNQDPSPSSMHGLLGSPASSLSLLSESGTGGALDDGSRVASPLAHLRDRDKQLSEINDRRSKDSAHWKPRASSAVVLEEMRDGGAGAPAGLRLHLNGVQLSSSPSNSLGSGAVGSEYGSNGNGNGAGVAGAGSGESSSSPPALLRSLTSPPRAVLGSGLGGIASPGGRDRLDSGAIPLFLRKHSTDHRGAGERERDRDRSNSRFDSTALNGSPNSSGASLTGSPSDYRDRAASSAAALALGSPLASVPGTASSGLEGKWAQEVTALRQHVNQHSTELEMQIADIESALSSADIGSMKARLEVLEEAQRSKRNDVDARLQRIESELQTMKQVQRTNLKNIYDVLNAQSLNGSGPSRRAQQAGLGGTMMNLFYVLLTWFGLGIATMSESIGALYPWAAAATKEWGRKIGAVLSTQGSAGIAGGEGEHERAGGGGGGGSGGGSGGPSFSGGGSGGSGAGSGASHSSHSTFLPMALHSHADRERERDRDRHVPLTFPAGRLSRAELAASKAALRSTPAHAGGVSGGGGGGGANGTFSDRGARGGSSGGQIYSNSSGTSREASLSRGAGGAATQRRLHAHSRPSSSLASTSTLASAAPPLHDDDTGVGGGAGSRAQQAAAAAMGALLDSDDDDAPDGEGARTSSGGSGAHAALGDYSVADGDGDAAGGHMQGGGGGHPSDSDRSHYALEQRRFADGHEPDASYSYSSTGGGIGSGGGHNSSLNVSSSASIARRSVASARSGSSARARPSASSSAPPAPVRSTMAQLRSVGKALQNRRT